MTPVFGSFFFLIQISGFGEYDGNSCERIFSNIAFAKIFCLLEK